MAEILYIRLPSQANESVHWLVWSPVEQEIIASGELTDAHQLVQLTDKAKQRQVISFVPCCDVAFRSIHVPAKSNRAMRLAAPYMLEDELAEDVDQLFFAYNTIKDEANDHNCFVAAVQHQQMKSWLSWLSAADIECKVMIPDALAMPLKSDAWQVIQLAEQVLIRQQEWQALTIDAALWPTLIALWIKKDPTLVIESYSPLPASEVEYTTHQKAEELPLALLAQHNPKQAFNLLQDEYQVKTQHSPALKTWAWAAAIATVALLINMLFKVTTLMQLNDQQAIVEQEIIDIYQATFPKTKRIRITTVRSQLKRKLADIGPSANTEKFLLMLDKLVPAFSQTPELKPESFKFDSKRNELRMQATASAYSAFEKFKTLLEASQLSVSQGAQNNQGNVISGSFSISYNTQGGDS